MSTTNNLDEFCLLLGRTIMCFQCIENDLKMVYVGMKGGDFQKNLATEKKTTLGRTVAMLQKLDGRQENPFFSGGDYKVLRGIAESRNRLCHQVFLGFVYEKGFLQGETFAEECASLKSKNDEMEGLRKRTEEIRLQFFGFGILEEDEEDDE